MKVRILKWQNLKLEDWNEKCWKLESQFWIFAKKLIIKKKKKQKKRRRKRKKESEDAPNFQNTTKALTLRMQCNSKTPRLP